MFHANSTAIGSNHQSKASSQVASPRANVESMHSRLQIILGQLKADCMHVWCRYSGIVAYSHGAVNVRLRPVGYKYTSVNVFHCFSYLSRFDYSIILQILHHPFVFIDCTPRPVLLHSSEEENFVDPDQLSETYAEML
uniref:Uncharacterized protein n=1 Tax=Medicago truncatula TaxID=3880 RepID=I3SPX0_MEDTR|nr:unknown [Medicago truncatula]